MDFGSINPGLGFWWQQGKGDVGKAVTAMLGSIATQSRHAREDVRFYLDLASNSNVAGNDTYGVGDGGGSYGRRPWGPLKMRLNITCMAVDTAASLIAQNRTAPIYLTTLGDFQLSRISEQRSRVIQAQFYDLGAYDLGAEIFKDGAKTGTGIVKGLLRNGLPSLERVLPNELFVDDMDGRYRKPRSLYQVAFVPKEVLKTIYPKSKDEIGSSGGPTDSDWLDFNLRRDSCVDRVRVVEAWHLPSAKGAKDGRHVICTDNVVLVDEPWTRDRFPFAVFRYENRAVGYFGQGVVERVCPAQIRVNELMKTVKDCQDLCSNTIIAVPENCNVRWEDLTNMPGQMVFYRGVQPPQAMTWTGTPPDLVAELAQIKAEVWEQEGFAQSTVSGEKPAGLSSGRAVRAADDVMSRRQIDCTRRFEQFYLQLTQLISDMNDDCAEMDPDYSVTGRSRFGRQTFLKTSKWTDLALPDGDVRVSMFPMSALPTTPQGRFSAIDEWIQGGYVAKPQALDLMEFPDIDAWQQLENADIDLVYWQIDRLLDGNIELPIEYQSIEIAVPIVTNAYKVAYRMQAPDEVLTAFERYLKHAETIVSKVNTPDPNAPAALNPNAAAAANVALQQAGGAPMAAPAVAA